MANDLPFIAADEFRRTYAAAGDRFRRLGVVADMCRYNTLLAVKRAGSGHLGSSFSAMDIVVWLYYEHLNVRQVGLQSPERDIYFSSKGHDVPGLYSVLASVGLLPEESLGKLRRLGGLEGHPSVGTPGMEASTGSLGMGISKGRGMAWAKKYLGRGGRVVVMTGDGELQEGQIYEALQTTAQQRVGGLTVVVDRNQVQTDKTTDEITALGDLVAKFRAFGWHVARCDGHSFEQLEAAFREFEQVRDRPKVLVAETVKGKGVSFMEHPRSIAEGKGVYKWHSGAPDDLSFEQARQEILQRINSSRSGLGLAPLPLGETYVSSPALGAPKEYVADAYGKRLVELAAKRRDLIVLDGDLAADCRVREFERTYPGRFIENGIAEQDMVSMAGGLARAGLLPVVNSFASFLAARANEQIYNNACEGSKVIYACHYAGLLPAGPGKSHQSIRDISLFGALPNCTIVEPCNQAEAVLALDYCVEQATGPCALRLVIGPSPRRIELPGAYDFVEGRGALLVEGDNALLFTYGPVMLHEALSASELLRDLGVGLAVVNMPWLNRVDDDWLRAVVCPYRHLFTLDDHSPVGGLGDSLLNALARTDILQGRTVTKLAVNGYPACGTPLEVLKYHRLDAASVAQCIAVRCSGGAARAVDNAPETSYSAEAPQ